MKKTLDPLVIENHALKLYLVHRYGKKRVSDFSVEGNVLSWTFYGKDQKHTGVYSLTLVVNEGDSNMITVDACRFLTLVDCDCKTGGSDVCGVTSESVELVSTIEYMAGGSVTVDTELSETSMNPLANATITAELNKKVSAVEGMGLSSYNFTYGYKMKLDSFLIINPVYDLRAVLSGKIIGEDLGVPKPCILKESDDRMYIATMVVEGYTSNPYDTTTTDYDVYKVTFFYFSSASKVKVDSDGKDIISQSMMYSPACMISIKSKAYLYTVATDMLQGLGESDVPLDINKYISSPPKINANLAPGFLYHYLGPDGTYYYTFTSVKLPNGKYQWIKLDGIAITL